MEFGTVASPLTLLRDEIFSTDYANGHVYMYMYGNILALALSEKKQFTHQNEFRKIYQR